MEETLQTLPGNESTADTARLEEIWPTAERNNLLRRVARAGSTALHCAQRALRFVPLDAPDYMSNHSSDAKAYIDPTWKG